MYAGPSKLHKKHSYRSQKVSGPLLSTCLPPAQSSELPLYSNLAPTTKALKETQNRVLQRHHHNIPKPQQAMCTNLSFFAIEVLTYIFIEKLPDLVRGFTGQQVLDGFWAALSVYRNVPAIVQNVRCKQSDDILNRPTTSKSTLTSIDQLSEDINCNFKRRSVKQKNLY